MKGVGSNQVERQKVLPTCFALFTPSTPELYLQASLQRLGLNCFHFHFIGFYDPSLRSLNQILFI